MNFPPAVKAGTGGESPWNKALLLPQQKSYRTRHRGGGVEGGAEPGGGAGFGAGRERSPEPGARRQSSLLTSPFVFVHKAVFQLVVAQQIVDFLDKQPRFP